MQHKTKMCNTHVIQKMKFRKICVASATQNRKNVCCRCNTHRKSATQKLSSCVASATHEISAYLCKKIEHCSIVLTEFLERSEHKLLNLLQDFREKNRPFFKNSEHNVSLNDIPRITSFDYDFGSETQKQFQNHNQFHHQKVHRFH